MDDIDRLYPVVYDPSCAHNIKVFMHWFNSHLHIFMFTVYTHQAWVKAGWIPLLDSRLCSLFDVNNQIHPVFWNISLSHIYIFCFSSLDSVVKNSSSSISDGWFLFFISCLACCISSLYSLANVINILLADQPNHMFSCTSLLWSVHLCFGTHHRLLLLPFTSISSLYRVILWQIQQDFIDISAEFTFSVIPL